MVEEGLREETPNKSTWRRTGQRKEVKVLQHQHEPKIPCRFGQTVVYPFFFIFFRFLEFWIFWYDMLSDSIWFEIFQNEWNVHQPCAWWPQELCNGALPFHLTMFAFSLILFFDRIGVIDFTWRYMNRICRGVCNNRWWVVLNFDHWQWSYYWSWSWS